MNVLWLPLNVHIMQLPLPVLLQPAHQLLLKIHVLQILIVSSLEQLVFLMEHHPLLLLVDVQILQLPHLLLNVILPQSIVHNSFLILLQDNLVHVVQHNHAVNKVLKQIAILIIHKLQLIIVFGTIALVSVKL